MVEGDLFVEDEGLAGGVQSLSVHADGRRCNRPVGPKAAEISDSLDAIENAL